MTAAKELDAAPSPYRPLPPPSALRLTAQRFRDAPPAFAIRVGRRVRSVLHRLADTLTPA